MESGDSPEYVGTAKKLLCALVPSYPKVGLSMVIEKCTTFGPLEFTIKLSSSPVKPTEKPYRPFPRVMATGRPAFTLFSPPGFLLPLRDHSSALGRTAPLLVSAGFGSCMRRDHGRRKRAGKHTAGVSKKSTYDNLSHHGCQRGGQT